MERTCYECGENIIFDKANMDNIIKFEKKYYHFPCFINTCKRKSSRSNAAPKWGVALESIDELQEKTKKFFNSNNDIEKDQVYQFIIDNYDIETVPNYIFIKLNEIYSGKRKGLTNEIPPEDLLDMWKQKKSNGFLDKIRAKNIVKNKKMSVAQQINYDMSVLVNMYDDYLKWKERKKITEQSVQNEINSHNVTINQYDKLSNNINKQKNEDIEDIDSLLEELFD